MSKLLNVQDVSMHFGGVHALTDVSFEVQCSGALAQKAEG